MDKFNIMQQDASSGLRQQPWGGFQPDIHGPHNPRPGIARPLTPNREEEEPDKKGDDPSKKKKKKNLYEIIC